MLLMRLRNIKKSFGETEILKHIDLDIPSAGKIGLVGMNGCGKTTLAKIIAGLERHDEGIIDTFQANPRIVYMKQSSEFAQDLDSYLMENAERSGDFLKTSSYLGLEKLKQREVMGEFLSGGEKTKLALARVFNEPGDLLILDEPTNHLDSEGIEWLIGEVEQYPKAMLIISHDRYFLDQTVEEIAEIEDGAIITYAGNYTFYRRTKDARYQSQFRAYQDQKRKEKEIDAEIERLNKWSYLSHRDSRKKEGFKEYWRVKAKKKDRQVKSIVKRLEKMKEEGVAKPKAEKHFPFTFLSEDKIGGTVISAEHLSKAFGERTLFADSSFYIGRGDKIGLIGANGSGKTTLIKMIIGEITDYQGKLTVSPSADIAYLSQDVMDLDENKSISDIISGHDKDFQSHARTFLAANVIEGRMIRQKIGTLSLGERTRIKLIFLILESHNVLILDEPTNHLDLPSREQLEKTLESYEGTLIIASHDRYLMEKITDSLLVFTSGSIARIDMGFHEYNQRRTEKETEVSGLVLENRITRILSELSVCDAGSERYQKLENDYQELMNQKKHLSDDKESYCKEEYDENNH